MIQSTEAFKRFANGQSWNQLDYQTQQQIRLMAILEQATAKYGTTLSQSVNGRISLFKSLLKDSALNIGNAFLPIINAIMPILNSFAMVLKNVTGKLAEFIALLFNKKASVKDSGVASAASSAGDALKDAAGGAGDLADAMDDADDASGGIADNLDDTAKSAKKAVKELLGLMGFDEINLLNKKDDPDDGDGAGKGRGGGGGGKGKKGKGGGGGAPFKDILPEVELTDMDNQFKSIFDGLGDKLKGLFDYLAKLWDLFKQGFSLSFRWDSLERLKNALSGIWKSIKDIFEDGTVLQAAARFGEKLAFALGQTAGAIANVIMGIAVFLAESLNKSLNDTKWDIKSWLIRMFDINGDMIASIGNIAQSIGQIFYDTITSEPATNMGAGLISAFTYAFMGVTEVVSKYTRDTIGSIEETITENQSGITELLTGLFKDLEPVAQAMASSMKKLFESVNQVYDEHIKPLLDSSSALMSDVVGSFVKGWNENIQPVLEKIGNGFADTIKNHIEPALEKIGGIIGSFADFSKAINEVFGPAISFIVEKLTVVLAPVIEYIGEVWRVLFNTIADVIGGIADIIKGVFDVLTGILTGDGEKIKEGFLSIFGGVKDIISSIFSGIVDLVLAALKLLWDITVAIFKSIWDAIIAIFSGIGSWFADRWADVTNALAEVGSWFSDKFQQGWDAISNTFSGLGSWFSERWSDVTNALSNIGAWFTDMFQNAWNGLTGIFANIGTWFGDRWSDVTNALSNVSAWFGDTFTRAYNAVVDAFSGIGSFFSGVWSTVESIFVNAGQMVGEAVGGAFRSAVNAVLGTIENVVNGFIGMINSVIGLINKIPGVHLGGIGYVSLPRLARGGIVDSPTVAMIGEAGKEVVMPLENTGFLQTMGRVVGGAVVDALGGNLTQSSGFSGDGDIVIQIGGHEFGRVAIQEINKEQERAGQVLLNI
nr:MAG TPA: minor tail protein [Caudoviricetes sp.]